MLIPLSDVLALPSFRAAGAQVLAGRPEGVLVRWVHSSEVFEMGGLLAGGEVLLTTGLGLHGRTSEHLTAYVEQLADAGLAALALELGRTFFEVPAAILEAAGRRQLVVLGAAPGGAVRADGRGLPRARGPPTRPRRRGSGLGRPRAGGHRRAGPAGAARRGVAGGGQRGGAARPRRAARGAEHDRVGGRGRRGGRAGAGTRRRGRHAARPRHRDPAAPSGGRAGCGGRGARARPCRFAGPAAGPEPVARLGPLRGEPDARQRGDRPAGRPRLAAGGRHAAGSRSRSPSSRVRR